jgi:hopanoid biosynthesis associated protein HpnK
MTRRRAVIVTADDFGLSREVNEAVEAAHRNGILTAASLMVGGAAAADAVERARRLPTLRVGLHLALVEARPLNRPQDIPALVGGDGRFRTDMARAGARIFFDPAARRQMRGEVEAQYAAFAATGLPLDHVNAHKHFHMHPSILAAALDAGRRHGLRAIRLPVEDGAAVNAIEPSAAGPGHRLFAAWARAQSGRIRGAGIAAPDRVFGFAWSGGMDEARVEALLRALPDGVSEIYFHPATADRFADSAPGYRYRDELAALVSPRVRLALDRSGARTGGYSDSLAV